MREILFKAKTTKKEDRALQFNNVWVQGDLICSNNKYYIHPNGNVVRVDGELGKIIVMHEVDPSTICQCTGLKDKNGKLIWENDIVRFQFDNDDCLFPNKDVKKRIGKVFFSDFRASWSIAMGINGSKCLNNDLFRYVQNGNRVEAIGNVFDNPGLLNE